MNIPVLRDAGTFGHVSVNWQVGTTSHNSSTDLTPVSGVVSFQPNQDMSILTISSVDDQVIITAKINFSK